MYLVSISNFSHHFPYFILVVSSLLIIAIKVVKIEILLKIGKKHVNRKSEDPTNVIKIYTYTQNPYILPKIHN